MNTQTVDKNAISDIKLAISDIETIMLDFCIDYGDKLPNILLPAVKILNTTLQDLRTLLGDIENEH